MAGAVNPTSNSMSPTAHKYSIQNMAGLCDKKEERRRHLLVGQRWRLLSFLSYEPATEYSLKKKRKKNKVQFKIQVHGSKNAYQKSTICKQSIRVFDGKL
jgi:hypothetical protein